MDKMELRRTLYKVGLKLYDHRDDIAFVGGTILSVVGSVLLVKKTFKQVEINKEHVEAKEEIEKSDISEEEKAEAIKNNNRKTIKRTIKNYAIPAGLQIAGVCSQAYGYTTERSKYSKMSLAYNGLATLYSAFRANVAADVGEEKCLEYEHGIRTTEIVDYPDDDTSGGNSVIKKEDEYANINGQRTFVFDKTNRFFNPSRGANDDTIGILIGNVKRRSKNVGFLDLATGLDMFGFDLMSEVTVNGKQMKLIHFVDPKAGWVWKDKNGGKDHEPMVSIVRRSGEGEEEKIVLKFNCVDDFRKYL